MENMEEVKGLFDEQASAFEAFKAANDEVLEQKADKGAADPVSEAKLEKINETLTDLGTKTDEILKEREKQAKTAETVAEIDERIKAVEAFVRRPGGVVSLTDKEKQQLIKDSGEFWHGLQADRKAEHKSALDADQMNEGNFLNYSKHLNDYFRMGSDHMEPEQRKELSVGAEADGGYWVTPFMLSTVMTRLFETSPMRAICGTQSISTDALVFPNDTNDATVGGWVGEKQTRLESATPQIGQQRIPVHEQYAEPHATQQLLDDAMINVESWLSGKIGDKLARTENTAFVTGNGEAKPRGILDYGTDATTAADTSRDWGTLQYTFTGVSGGFHATLPGDALIDIVHSLKAAYRGGARWLMARLSVAEVRKIKDGDGNYLWDMGNIRDNQPQSLLGYPISEGEDMPVIAANTFSIAFGNFGIGYLIVDRQGIRVLRDPFTAKPFVKFYTTKRVGGDVTNYDAIKLLKFGTS